MSYAYGRQQGDPGFLSFLGRAAGFASSFLPGGSVVRGVVGAVARKAAPIIEHAQPVIKAARAHPVLTAAAGAGTIGAGAMVLGGGGAGPPALPGGMMPGSLALPGGRGAGVGIRISPRGRRIKYNLRTGKAIRHMRVTNTKALSRAIRRAHGFARVAKKVLSFTSPKPKHGHMYFKRRKRKK